MLKNRGAAKLSNTRTDRDWIMIVLGVCLVIFFLVGACLSLTRTEKGLQPKLRGPVKDPGRLGALQVTPYMSLTALRRNPLPLL
jgi:hypothetical protein